MKVILLQDLRGTGKAGDVVKVSDGYARNMLIPKGIAKEATKGNIKNLNRQKEIKAANDAEAREKANAEAEKLANVTLKISSKGGEGGKLFGSITSKEISEELKKQQNIEIDKKKIQMDGPIKTAGEHTIKAKLYAEISANIHVEVSIEG